MRTKIEALVGSTVREVGILILVFAPLEGFLRGPAAPTAFIVSAVAGSLLLIAAGIIFEVKAERLK